MKFDIHNLNNEQFLVNQYIKNGKAVHLVHPNPKFHEWDQKNKIFRSSVWDNDGVLISAGFPKFVNWGELPNEFPVPNNLRGTKIVEKLDGSLLIVSKHEGDFILRTRGTIDAFELSNGSELEIFRNTILPNLPFQELETWDTSLLFEWFSPKQVIVINHGEQPDWYLVGVVNHKDYSLWNQEALDTFARDCGLKRPAIFNFDSIDVMLKNVDTWKGKEGICLYSNDDQSIHKIKSDWYLSLHRMKSELSSIEKIIDVWLMVGRPNYQDFYNYLGNNFDFELATRARGDISKICDASKEVDRIIEGMKKFVATELSKYPTRKLQAVVTFQSYGKNTNRAGFVFTLLDNKELNTQDYKKLLFQCLKK